MEESLIRCDIVKDKLIYELKFTRRSQLKYTHLGKGWPIHTQCILMRNGLLLSSRTIIKHAKDPDNKLFAYRLVAESCMKVISNNSIRAEVRVELNKFLEGIK